MAVDSGNYAGCGTAGLPRILFSHLHFTSWYKGKITNWASVLAGMPEWFGNGQTLTGIQKKEIT